MTVVGSGGTAVKVSRTQEPDLNPSGGISADYVIAFARLRLNTVEKNLQRLLGNMKSTNNDLTAINEITRRFNQLPKDGINGNADNRHTKLTEQIRSEMAKMDPSTPAYQYLKKLVDTPDSILNQGMDGKGSDQTVTPDEIQQIIRDLELHSKDIERSNSEGQLYVNKYIGEQSQVLQLAAQIISSINETAKAIIQAR
ncbi:MAG: hypothetical protein JST00_40165 [Deltaproteobacteria bacterium]|nr:hypothetical protein [Deltaproteobacteria bacterium]